MPPSSDIIAPAGAEHNTLYVAIEISRKSWVVGIKSPASERIGLHSLGAADVVGLKDLIEHQQTKAERALGREVRVLCCYEAGYEGFWLARWLDRTMSVETVVLDPASLLVNRKLHGIFDLQPRAKGFEARFAEVRTAYGSTFPPRARQEILRLAERFSLVERQIAQVEAERDAIVRQGEALAVPVAPEGSDAQAAARMATLTRLKGIGENDAALLTHEIFYRGFRNRRELASWVGITPTPWASGDTQRDQGISRDGPAWIRAQLVQMAWRWLRHQPDSALRVRPETLCRITEFSEHESNGRELDEGERVAVEVLPVLGQSAAAVEPGDGAFDHPTPGLDDEALHPIGSLDDLGLEIGQDAGQGAVKDRALIGAVGEQFPEKGKQTEQGRQQRETAVAILNVGGGADAVQQQALRIDQNMPLLALDQLAGIEAVAVDASPPFSALFTL